MRGMGEEEPVQGRAWGGSEGKATEDFDPSLRLGEEWRGEQGLREKTSRRLEFWARFFSLKNRASGSDLGAEERK